MLPVVKCSCPSIFREKSHPAKCSDWEMFKALAMDIKDISPVPLAHGLIAAIYFFINDGIKAKQVRAESVAYHERRIVDINRAKEILALAEQGAKDEDAIAAQYGGMEVLNEILGQLRVDAVISSEPQSAPTQAQAIKPVAIIAPKPIQTNNELPSNQGVALNLPEPAIVKSNGHSKMDPI